MTYWKMYVGMEVWYHIFCLNQLMIKNHHSPNQWVENSNKALYLISNGRLILKSQPSDSTHLLVYRCIQLGHLFPLLRETVRKAGIEGGVLGELGVPALHGRMLRQLPLEGKHCPLVGPGRSLLPSFTCGGAIFPSYFFTTNSLQKLFSYMTAWRFYLLITSSIKSSVD